MKLYGRLLTALGFSQVICRTSLLELHNMEGFIHLPSFKSHIPWVQMGSEFSAVHI